MQTVRLLRSKRPLRAAFALFAAALAVSIGACGGDDEQTSSTAAGGAGNGETPSGGSGSDGEVALMGNPPVEETIDEAVKRIEGVLDSGDCKKINELNPLGRPGLTTDQRCEVLKRLDGLEVVGTAEYGKLGGVIAFERGQGTLNVILVRDSDGLLHVDLIDPFSAEPGTEGKLAKEFEQVADKGAKAMADNDCEAFLEVAYRRFGLGGGTDKEVCERAENTLVAALLERGGEPTPVDLTGGASYAFFGIDTPISYVTVIAARESEKGVPPTLPKEIAELPKGAPEYGIVDAVRTNPRQPIEAPEDSSG